MMGYTAEQLEAVYFHEIEMRKRDRRDRFAAAALMGLRASGDPIATVEVAHMAAEDADALIAELATDKQELRRQQEECRRLEAHLAAKTAQAEMLAEAVWRELYPHCTCIDDYKARDLQDPTCRYCDQEELRAALRQYRGEKK